jgi:putative DNA topoisomerase
MGADLFDALTAGPEEKPVRQTPCPKCRQPMRRISGKMGPFWGCTTFPTCDARLYDRDGKPSETPDERYRCPVCTRPLARSDGGRKAGSGSGDTASTDRGADKTVYWYCLGYNKGCKVTLADEDGHPAKAWRCPKCGHLLKQRHGKAGLFWGCSQYPLCQASYPDQDGEPKLARTDPGQKRRS